MSEDATRVGIDRRHLLTGLVLTSALTQITAGADNKAAPVPPVKKDVKLTPGVPTINAPLEQEHVTPSFFVDGSYDNVEGFQITVQLQPATAGKETYEQKVQVSQSTWTASFVSVRPDNYTIVATGKVGPASRQITVEAEGVQHGVGGVD